MDKVLSLWWELWKAVQELLLLFLETLPSIKNHNLEHLGGSVS